MVLSEQLERLMRLQAIQEDIARISRDRANLQKDIAAREQVVRELEEELERLHDERITTQKAGDSLEVKIQAGNDENARLRIQLNTTRSQKDYDAIRRTIMSNEADIMKWEDEELEALEMVDEQKRREAGLKSNLAEEKNKLESIKESVSAARKQYDAEIEKLTEKTDAVRRQINPELLSKFDQISNSKNKRALVKLKNRVCGGCFTRVPKQIENELMRGGSTVFCHSCGRILMLNE